MLRTIEMYTNEYKDTTQKEIRKKKGQFFTPAEVSMRMAAVESEYPKNQWIRVLDPGAGNGILSFAVIDKLLRSGYKRLDITLIETDKEIFPEVHERGVIKMYCPLSRYNSTAFAINNPYRLGCPYTYAFIAVASIESFLTFIYGGLHMTISYKQEDSHNTKF